MGNYRENFTRVLICTSLVILLIGCASKTFVEGGYDTISTANTTVHELMNHLGKQYQAGEITETQKEHITQIYNQYRSASDAADTALATYAQTDSEQAKENYLLVLRDLLNYREKFLNLATALLQ